MRTPRRRGCASRRHAQPSTSWLLKLTSFASLAHAISFNSIPDANLDISQLGQIGIAGDFSGLSLYQFEGQSEQPFSTNGTGRLMGLLPNGVFTDLLIADASIQAMCDFQGQVILGGNFTSLDGKESQGIASFDPNTLALTPLDGLSGQVNSLLCDDSAGLVYVGGSFSAAESNNAITWLASGGWTSLSFAGFNGPVTSIAKASSGKIIFGGGFTGLGNASTPSDPDLQVINLSTADIQADQGTDTAGFSDPRNIVCQESPTDGSGTTWLLEDNTPGAWRASFGFGFEPTKLTLWNTHQDGRGTKTWRFTALPLGGILNFTYIDPATGVNTSCTSECPLSDDPAVEFQEFHFVNTQIGMNAFRIDISDWYGQGGGLNGIALFQDDIFAYAINDFNEPTCNTSIAFPSKAEITGDWEQTQASDSNSGYLSARLSKPITNDAATVIFYPDIRESGNYTFKLYTPGCRQDNTCLQRGRVTAHLNLSREGSALPNLTVFQTNDFEKYDQLEKNPVIYVDASSDSFRPSVTLYPEVDQSQIAGDEMVFVASRVGFELLNSTGGLNGLFEYDPTQATVDTSDFDSSAINRLGSSFTTGSTVQSLLSSNDILYIGGNFTSDDQGGPQNIVAIDSNGQTIALDGGLNGQVLSMYLSGDQMFVGGRFNGTSDGSTTDLANIAVYDPGNNQWSPLGAGVNGLVQEIVPMTVNLTGDTSEEVITLTGGFTQLLAFGDNAAADVTGFAVWVKSQNNWLQNLDTPVPFWAGSLTTFVNLQDNGTLFAGSISSQALKAASAASGGNALGNFPINIEPAVNNSTTSSLSKRASVLNSTDSISGVVAGGFNQEDGRNITVLAGHFTAKATDGSTIYNLALIDGANSNPVTGLNSGVSPDSVFLAVGIVKDSGKVFAGGRVNGTIGDSSVTGLVSYDSASGSFDQQPPTLGGSDVAVSAIKIRTGSNDVFVGGSFDTAGSLPCPSVCLLDAGSNEWSRPGFELGGVVNGMTWSTDTVLLAGGQLTINDTETIFVASFDTSGNSWTEFPGSSTLPGPVDALTTANQEGDEIWVAGTKSEDGTPYLMKSDNSAWISAPISLGAETVISSIQSFTLTKEHDETDIMDAKHVLMITGSIDIPDFGMASSAIFNGTTLQPYMLSSSANNTVGSISNFFVQNQTFFTGGGSNKMPVGFVVLIALAISLGLLLLIVVAGLALDRYRKKRDGYVPAPTSMFDRGSGMQRIPPGELLDSLSKGRPGAPHV
ncbi:cortical protein marker for cell polarity-domain-containing protein [Xylariomycetidae sp. FL2044]|nr:cortical protein marker for cell polarity-domain-containing protein [Xylariomycetidae sp. FL2044]